MISIHVSWKWLPISCVSVSLTHSTVACFKGNLIWLGDLDSKQKVVLSTWISLSLGSLLFEKLARIGIVSNELEFFILYSLAEVKWRTTTGKLPVYHWFWLEYPSDQLKAQLYSLYSLTTNDVYSFSPPSHAMLMTQGFFTPAELLRRSELCTKLICFG